MSTQHEVIKSNWLQHKVRKKTGTLIRRKKVRYEEAEWVVLCVHDDRIPLLEWYYSKECSEDHRPTKVLDLLDSAFVTPVISDRRSFVIGFTHSSREPIELTALTPEDCREWVEASTEILVRLRCLNDSTNVYTALPDSIPMIYPNSVEQRPFHFSLDDEVPQGLAPIIGVAEVGNDEASPYEHLALAVCSLDTSDQNSSSESSTTQMAHTTKVRRKSSCGKEVPPPLPPRDTSLPNSPNLRSSRAESVYDFPRNCVSSRKEMYGTLERNQQSSVNSPSPTCVSPVSPPNRSSEYSMLTHVGSILSQEIAPAEEATTKVNVKRGYSIPSSIVVSPRGRRSSENATMSCANVNGTLKNNGYDVPLSASSGSQFRLSSLVPAPEVQAMDSMSDTNSSVSPRALKSPIPSSSLYATPLGTRLTKLTPVALQLTLCVESIAFVEINERIWIAGWTASSDKHLTGVLRVGDELVQVGGVKVEEIGQLPGLFYSSSIPGSPVNLLIRQVPYGSEYAFTKTSRSYNFGVVLRKRKNKLEEVREGSPAFQGGLRAHMTGMNGTLTATCVTHFDGRSLSLFSRNEELLNLIDMVPFMSKFTLIIQPYDFIKEIKRGIKKMKNYGVFVRD